MSELEKKILEHVASAGYRPQQPRKLADELELAEPSYQQFRTALRDLMHQGRIILGARGAIMPPSSTQGRNEIIGTFRQNRKGFGFVIPTDPSSHADLYIGRGENGTALTGDVVRARIIHRGERDGKSLCEGRIVEILKRGKNRFVGSLLRQDHTWLVMPDGNTLPEPILTPDAASRHLKPGTKVVVELTRYPESGQRGQGVITDVLGEAGEKDVDLRSVLVQFNLPDAFPDAAWQQARDAVDRFDPSSDMARREDLSGMVICTIDPDDAKDYDDAISLRQVEGGDWELGVHIADVSHFVPEGSALDEEARERGNSAYFPGFVIPMLPEILSNGVCSLQEGVPRLCKSAFIIYDDQARPVRSRFASTIIRSANRLRYREAQAIIDAEKIIPHPDGPRPIGQYKPEVVSLLGQMNDLATRLQKRRREQGQLVLDLPEVELVLDENGRVADAIPEDQSFTHTLIEMFMVEANEAVARLLDGIDVPFLRRVHPDPDLDASSRLRMFVEVAGHRVPKDLDRKALQKLLDSIKGRPEAFAINLAVLKSLTRAEYSPQPVGHYALASEHYCHFTSPIRRYADLTIHRLLDKYLEAVEAVEAGGRRNRRGKVELDGVPSVDDLVQLGRHLSFTERRAEDAERELRQVKVLELLSGKIGEEYLGVITGITGFGIFIQIKDYLIDGLIRYEDLMDDWWDVDERAGAIRGQRTGRKIGIGDVVKVSIVKVDMPRRELDLAITELLGRSGGGPGGGAVAGARIERPAPRGKELSKSKSPRGGESRRNRQSKVRDRRR